MVNFILILGIILIWKVWFYIGINKYFKTRRYEYDFYVLELLRLSKPYLILDKFMQIKYLPENKGKIIKFRRYGSLNG